MKSHEDFDSANNKQDEHELFEFGTRNLPEYTQRIWERNCNTLDANKLNDLANVLKSIKRYDYEHATSMIKRDYLGDGSMMSMVAVLLPEGVNVIRKVYTDTWGESGLAQSIDFLDGCMEWHKEQQKNYVKKTEIRTWPTRISEL